MVGPTKCACKDRAGRHSSNQFEIPYKGIVYRITFHRTLIQYDTNIYQILSEGANSSYKCEQIMDMCAMKINTIYIAVFILSIAVRLFGYKQPAILHESFLSIPFHFIRSQKPMIATPVRKRSNLQLLIIYACHIFIDCCKLVTGQQPWLLKG